MVVAFAALGGVGQAQNAISAGQSQYGKKVTICHKGKTIKVSKHAVRAHLRHGDTLGPCSTAKKKAKHKKHGDKAKHEEHAAKVKAADERSKATDDEKSKADEKSKTDKPGKGKGRGK
jgi:hypothetical protein